MNRATFVTSLTGTALAASTSADALTPPRFAGADRAIAALAAADTFSGVAAVYDGARPVWQKAYGLANRSDGIANTAATRFNVGSLCKLFTTAIFRAYVRAGRVRLEDTVGTYLPAYPNAQVKSTVTIGQLIAMRSGVPDFFNERFEKLDHGSIDSLAGYLPFFADLPLAFEPGMQQAYSNGGFLILGLIIEAIEKTSYYDAVARMVFEPAGMRDAGFFAVYDIQPRVATGYVRRPKGDTWMSNVALLPGRGSSAGGGYATAGDLAAFVHALDTGVLTIAPPSEAGMRKTAASFRGGAPGVNASMRAGIAEGYTAIVLANMSPPSAESVLAILERALGDNGMRPVA